MLFRMYFQLDGTLRIEEPFDFRGFHFHKTNAGEGAMYDFPAPDQEEADLQEQGIVEKLEQVLDLLSLERKRDFQISSINGPMPPSPHSSLSVHIPIDPQTLSGTERLGGMLKEAVTVNPRIPLAMRWLRKSLGANECIDAFLAAWISLEALAEERKRVLTPEEESAVEDVRKCVKDLLPHDKFPRLRSSMIQEWLDKTTRLSIPESMTELVESVFGPEYEILERPAGDCLRVLQGERSNLVHDAKPIPDACEKARAIRDLAWRLIHALIGGKDFLRKLNRATPQELQAIAGLGSTLAIRILKRRSELLEFTSLEQLRAIPGVGKGRLVALRTWAREG